MDIKMIRLKNICKEYKTNKFNKIEVFNDLNFEIKKGDFVAVVGKSGSGKSTLLNILSGLDTPTLGEYYFNGEKVPTNNGGLAQFRQNNIGMIVQNSALISEWNAYKNIALPLVYRKLSKEEIQKRIHDVTLSLGIDSLVDKYPNTLSGGQNQRVAIARAIIGQPSILIADEPTASLDEENKMNVIEILKDLNKKGMTVIIATHDKEIYEKCDYRIEI